MTDAKLTKADQIVANGKVPTEYAEAAKEISEMVVAAYKELETTPREVPHEMTVGTLRRLPDNQREEFKITHLDPEHFEEFAEDDRIVLADEDGNTVMRLHPLHFNAENHGLHAYRYEELSDGSVVAIYANDEKGTIKFKSFANIEEASAWTPRDERQVVRD